MTNMARVPRSWSAAVLAVTAAGCGCDDEHVRPAGAAIEVLASADPDAPLKLDLGAVPVGQSVEAFVEVHNRGVGPLTVGSIELVPLENGEDLSLAKVMAFDCENAQRPEDVMVLAGGACARFAVRFTPSARHPVHATVKILSSDELKPEIDVDVVGIGALPAIRVCVVVPPADSASDESLDCTDFTTDPPKIPTLAFGPVHDGDEVERRVRVYDDGAADLQISDVHVGGDTTQFSISGGTLPTLVRAGQAAETVVKFAPTIDGAVSAKVVFVSQAPYADPEHPQVEIPVTAEGQGPRLCVEPPSGLDFGSVVIGQTRALPIRITNCGVVSYKISALALSQDLPGTNEFTTTPMPMVPFEFPPGDFREIEVTYAPHVAERDDTGQLFVRTDFGLSQRVPIKGHGGPPACDQTRPTAAIRGPTTVRPLDTINLDGSTSTAPSGPPITYAWRLVSQPPNGTQGIMGSGPRVQVWAEYAGDYVVELVVADRYRCQSAPARHTVHSVPTSQVNIELSWRETFGDVDLHFLALGNGAYHTSTDCYYANMRPNWGLNNTGSPDGDRTNDPSLDIDQLWGHGPEHINHPMPFDGVYRVQVQFYCNRRGGSSYGAAHPMVTIYVNGSQVLKRTFGDAQTFPSAANSFLQRAIWTVAEVRVTTDSNGGKNISVVPVNEPLGQSGSNQACSNDTN